MKRIICLSLVLFFCSTLAFALDLDGVKEHFLKGEWKDSIQEGEAILAKANRNSSDLDQLYYYLGMSYFKNGQCLRAADIFEVIIKEFPESKLTPQATVGLNEARACTGRAIASATAKTQGQTPEQIEAQVRASILASTPPEAEKEPEPNLVLSKDLQNLQTALEPKLSSKSVWIQVGAFSSRQNADNLASKLRDASYKVGVSHGVTKGRDIFKVRVGPYVTRDEALAVSKKLGLQGYPIKIVP
jgi:hypothetical protein